VLIRPGDRDMPVMRVHVLGGTRVETAEGAVDREWLSQQPGRLLRYLVCQHGRFAPVDQIIEALWPRSDPRANENVRYLVHLLRRRLEPNRPLRAPSAAIQCRRAAYALGEAVWVDAQAFETLVHVGLTAAAAGQPDALVALDQAIELYEGDFLADEPYADWAMLERDRIRSLLEQALETAADLCERARDVARAADYLRWQADLLRYDSDVQLRLIKLCLRGGRRSEAVRRYDAFRIRLLREFGEEPEFDLADALAAGAAVGPTRQARLQRHPGPISVA
jgi:two-component SAPR family response regulator